MNMVETLRATRSILDRRTQRKLWIATLATLLIALLDTVAIALVLPLVSLASGEDNLAGVGAIITRLLGDPGRDTLLLVMTVGVVLLFVLKDLGALAFSWWLGGFRAVRRVDLSARLLEHFMRMSYTDVSRRSSAELLRTMNEAVTQFYGTTVFGLMTIVSNVASLVAIAIALLVSAPLPSLALGAYFAVAAVFYLRVLRPRSTAAGRVAAEASSAAYRTAFAALGGIKEAKLRGSQSFFVGSYREAALRGELAGRLAGFISGAPRYLLEILFILALGGMLVAGTTVSTGEIAGGVGVMALFVAAGLRALPAVTSLVGQISNLRYGAGFLDVVLAEVQQMPATERATSVSVVNRLALEERISLERVSFTYPDSAQPAVHPIDLIIPRGRTVAIVGGSGAGKTTLVDLLLGLHRPTRGRICIDGRDVHENLSGWQRNIGYVPQEVFLREATLAENIAFDVDADHIDPVRLDSAIRRAQLSDVVQGLPQGAATHIGERGSRLSGGQRQRIGIARAIYQQPHLLVLDEATSALDNETEHRVSEAIRELHGELTMIIVAHRLSTVRHADQVILMHEGRIEAVGSFDDLRRTSSRFATMTRLGSLE